MIAPNLKVIIKNRYPIISDKLLGTDNDRLYWSQLASKNYVL